MKYFRAKKIVDEFTTKSFSQINNTDKVVHYAEIDAVQYFGVDSTDLPALLTAQAEELDVQELTYAEIKPILNECRKMKDFDLEIENGISTKYTVGREFKMKDLSLTDPKRIEYEAFKESVKSPIRLRKIELGLIQVS